MNRLLDRGANINARGERDTTPLMLAVGIDRDLWVIDLLLDRGSDISLRGENGATALHLAAAFSQDPSVIVTLLSNGASIELTDDFGRIAHDYLQQNDALMRSRANSMLSP